ncbi:MAG: hypothetical protein ACRDOP_02305 [Gaiellaceae bacterium]
MSIVSTFVALGACGGDGGSPYYDPDSLQGDYCEGVDDYFDWGEPGSLHAVPFALPIAVAVALGLIGVQRRRGRFLVRAGSALAALPVLHVLVAYLLPG